MQPIFLFGAQRSGTTFLGSLLGAHSDLLCIPEYPSKFLPLQQKKSKPIDLENFFDRIYSHWRFRLWDLELDKNEIPFDEFSNNYGRLLEWIVGKYGSDGGKNNCILWVDHTPTNINHVDFLLELFPQARFIHIVRDGRGVFGSSKRLGWGACTGQKASSFWMEKIAVGLAAEAFIPKEQCIRIKYEDILQSTEDVLKQLCGFLGIDFQCQMVSGKGFKVPNYTKAQHSLVGKKPEISKAHSWVDILSNREIEIFEYKAGKVLKYLGYDNLYGQFFSDPPNLFENIDSIIKEKYKYYASERRIVKRAKAKYRGS